MYGQLCDNMILCMGSFVTKGYYVWGTFKQYDIMYGYLLNNMILCMDKFETIG